MQEIILCAAGAVILALLVTWILVRANRRQDYRSAADARRRLGENRITGKRPEFAMPYVNRDNPDGSQVRVGSGPQFARGGKGTAGGKGGAGGVAHNTGPAGMKVWTTSADNDWPNNPLNPASPLHSVCYPSSAPDSTPHTAHCGPSHHDSGSSYSPSDSGSSSSCDSSSSSSDSGSSSSDW